MQRDAGGLSDEFIPARATARGDDLKGLHASAHAVRSRNDNHTTARSTDSAEPLMTSPALHYSRDTSRGSYHTPAVVPAKLSPWLRLVRGAPGQNCAETCAYLAADAAADVTPVGNTSHATILDHATNQDSSAPSSRIFFPELYDLTGKNQFSCPKRGGEGRACLASVFWATIAEIQRRQRTLVAVQSGAGAVQGDAVQGDAAQGSSRGDGSRSPQQRNIIAQRKLENSQRLDAPQRNTDAAESTILATEQLKPAIAAAVFPSITDLFPRDSSSPAPRRRRHRLQPPTH